MKRYKHSLSNYRLITGDMGVLIPIQLQEILPGDSLKANSAALIRLSPLVAPVMHPVVARIHHWFVPHRLTWPQSEEGGWEDFITGGKDGNNQASIPTVTPPARSAGDLLDYLGVPPVNSMEVSALPHRAYNLIFNEFYRDQDLQSEATVGNTLQRCCWAKDYFTSARPWPQKGPDITVPLGDQAPIVGLGKLDGVFADGPQNVFETDNPDAVSYASGSRFSDPDNRQMWVRESADVPGTPGIYADLTNATAANVNDWRRAFALQRYQEARAQYGSRYTEYLQYLGVTPSDSRLQRPEYLGGGKATINFSEVLQTQRTDDGETPLGTMGGHGIAGVKTRNFVRHFNEHGYLISLMSLRPKSIYADGIPRTWLKRDKEDFWQRELEQIGQQAVLDGEVYATTGGNTNTFGWQDRYSEYKHTFSGIAGDFRNVLDYWHMARMFDSQPALNSEFVTCTPTKRIFAEQLNNSLWCMVQNNVAARRFVRKASNSRIL